MRELFSLDVALANRMEFAKTPTVFCSLAKNHKSIPRWDDLHEVYGYFGILSCIFMCHRRRAWATAQYEGHGEMKGEKRLLYKATYEQVHHEVQNTFER